jgi:30S ribosomal protein S31
MGKGDKKTKRGKIIIGSYGVSRKRRDPSAKRTGVKAVAAGSVVNADDTMLSAEDALDKAQKKAAVKTPKKADETAVAEE